MTLITPIPKRKTIISIPHKTLCVKLYLSCRSSMAWEDQDILHIRTSINLRLLQFGSGWHQENLPCLCEHFSIAVQATFLGILVLRFVQHLISVICKRRTKPPAPDQGTDEYGNGVQFGSTIYKTSMACSLFLMATHFTVILLLLNGSVPYCNYKYLALYSEGMQVASWAFSSVALCKIVNVEFIKFPWLLRVWWILGFLLSTICVGVGTHLRIKAHGELRLQDYAGYLSLLASTCLFGISIRGNTGVTFTATNDITEPLLNAVT